MTLENNDMQFTRTVFAHHLLLFKTRKITVEIQKSATNGINPEWHAAKEASEINKIDLTNKKNTTLKRMNLEKEGRKENKDA